MGIYREKVLPRIIDKACGMQSANHLRERVVGRAHGKVVEIGFGSGHNIPFYTSAISSVTAIEPADLGWKLAAKRVAASPVTIERGGLDGQSLPFEDGTFDAAISTWTLCTIPDDVQALQEVLRVLKPGGTLHFIEHGLAPDEKVQRTQRRMEPFNRKVFGGCHLTRPIAERIESAGFEMKELDVFYEKGAPKFVAADSLGIAVAS